jgi:hypothetical protein
MTRAEMHFRLRCYRTPNVIDTALLPMATHP